MLVKARYMDGYKIVDVKPNEKCKKCNGTGYIGYSEKEKMKLACPKCVMKKIRQGKCKIIKTERNRIILPFQDGGGIIKRPKIIKPFLEREKLN